MRIWLLTVGEPLPSDQENVRLYRTGLLFNELYNAGIDVIWWTSNFNHTKKIFRSVNNDRSIVFLNALKYKSNLSLRRILSHICLAKDFKNKIKNYPPPDVIISSFPTIELCREAVKFANKNKIPIIIDVRDLWPDIFLNHVPSLLKFPIRIFLSKMFRDTAYVFKNATCVSGVSKTYLDWGLNKANRSIRPNDFVIHMGYPKIVINEDETKRIKEYLLNLGYEKDKYTVLFIGTFGETYDLLTVIRAVQKYPTKFNKMQFIFCGNGPKYNKWKNEAKGLKSVIFTDWIDAKKIKYLLVNASVGLAAYKKGAPQGLPNKIFEYMSTGLPILSSLEGEAEEFIKENKIGYTYIADSINSFVEKINKIMNGEIRAKFRDNSNRLFNSKFSSAVVYRDFAKKIKEIAIKHN